MGRQKKPLEEVSPKYRRKRLLYEENPKKHEEYKKYLKESYFKNKPKHQLRKKLKVKEQRESALKKLGNKCASCGEPYNPNSVPTNLHIDHKFYLKTRDKKPESFREVLNQINAGIDPNIQFNLLCYSCHMVVTNIRKHPEKALSVLDYLKKNNILKEE